MAETVRCVMLITLTIAFFGSADEMIDSVPAAITVYRNPEFFRNLTERKEDLEKEEEEGEEEKEEEGKGDAYSNNSEEFYDFDEEYRYPGEPKKPNPPASPDFITYFDESPEFQPESRTIPPSKGGIEEEEVQDENDRNGHLSHYQYENDEDTEEIESNDERESETISEEDYGYNKNQDDEKSDESEDEREAMEEEEEEEAEEDVESKEHSTENTEDKPKKMSKYHVPMEKDLQMVIPARVYEDSKEYFNPVLNSGITAFNYPASYEDLDYFSYEDEDKKKRYVDKKKGTREYLKDHSVEEVEDPRNTGNVRAGTKHVFRTVSKIGIHAFKPVLYVPHVHRIKKKYKILHKPKKFYKWGHLRQLPDDSVYQFSSDYDSEFEFL